MKKYNQMTEKELRCVEVYPQNIQELYNAGRRDFRKVNLKYAQLSGARLSGCDFRRANFAGADLSHADLSSCDLRDAVFMEIF